MAHSEYPYKPVTIKEMEKFIRWFQSEFEMRDFCISLFVGDVPPDWASGHEEDFGTSKIWCLNNTAFIWVNKGLSKKTNTSLLQIVCHEMLEVLFIVLGYKRMSNDPACYSFERQVLELYWYKSKKKFDKPTEPEDSVY